ncbi:MAG: hypothetical protein JWQ40_2273, partial [Segetibacter sp.]|nr:hypothetical protein [Segetibacter sp.]
MKFSFEKSSWFLYAGIAAYALYCYNPFVLFFQNDDFIHIPLSRQGQLFQRNSFRPVCDLSVMADEYLYGKNAAGYHLTNLLLHLGCCWLVFLVSKKIIEKYFDNLSSKRMAFIVALFFFVYATHGEAVLWILGRSAILGLVFSLLFLLEYVKREETIFSIAKYILLLSLALLSYESSFILPLLCVFFFLIDREKNDRVHLTIVFISFGVYLLARWLVIGEIYGSYEVNNIGGNEFLSVIGNFGKLLMRSFVPAYTQGVIIVIIFSAIAISILVLLVKSPSRKKLVLLAGVFLVSLLPYCTLGIAVHSYEGERFLYFPAFFLCLLMVLTISASFKQPLERQMAFLVILLVHSISLSISASDFRIAGNVNKMMISSFNTIEGIDSLYVHQLPQVQNGALIMRDGFKEAITW